MPHQSWVLDVELQGLLFASQIVISFSSCYFFNFRRFVYVCECFAFICVCVPRAWPDAHRGQKKISCP